MKNIFLYNFYFFKNLFFLKKKNFNINLKKNTIKIENRAGVKKQNCLKKLILISLRNGFFLKFSIFFLKSFNLFFNLFLFNNQNFFSLYKNTYLIYLSFFKSNNFFFNINFILFWISNILEPIFSIKCLDVPKKYRKKLKKKHLFDIFFLNFEKRKKILLKWLVLNKSFFFEKNYVLSFFKSFILVFLKNKKSELYLKKINIYKKAISKYYKI